MGHAVLIGLGLLTMPERYPHLPSEAVCEAMHKACCQDLDLIHGQQSLAGARTSKSLQEMRGEASRAEQAWNAVWWLQWRRPGGPLTREECEQWENCLLDLIGQHAFYRGEIPLPLSLRVQSASN